MGYDAEVASAIKTNWLPALAGFGTALLGASALLGGTPWTAVAPPMSAQTGLGVFLGGTALMALALAETRRWAQRGAGVLAGAALLLGTIGLVAYLLAAGGGLDQDFPLLWSPLAPSGSRHMAPSSAYALALGGGALLCMTLRARPAARVVAAGAAVSLLLLGAISHAALVLESLLGWQLGVDGGMARASAAGFLLLGVGLCALGWRSGVLGWAMGRSASIGFAAAGLALLALSCGAGRAVTQLVQAVDAMNRHQLAIDALRRIAGGQAELESGQRGFLILGEESELSRRAALRAQVREALQCCRDASDGDGAGAAPWRDLERLTQLRDAFGELTIGARREQGFAAAQALLATHRGIDLSHDIRTTLDGMRAAESAAVERHSSHARVSAQASLLLLPLGVFACLSLGMFSLFGLNQGLVLQERSARSLRRSEELFEKAFRLSPDGLAVVREDDRVVLRANEAFAQLWGQRVQDILGKPSRDFGVWEDEGERGAFLARLDLDGQASASDAALRLTDGRRVRLAIAARRIDLDGEPILLSVLRDVTAERHAEAGQQRLAALVDSSDDAILAKTLDGVITAWNRGAERLFGYTAAEAVGRSVLMLFPPGMEAEESDIQMRLRRGERVESFDTVRLRKDGARVDISVTVSPILDAAGRVVGASKIARDITARKRAELALRDSEQRYRTTLENMMEGCQIVGFDWTYLYINEAAARHGRRPREEFLGRNLLAQWPGFEQTPSYRLMRRCMEEGAALQDELEFTYPDGSSAWFELRCQPVPEGVFVLSIDVTQRKLAERHLRELNESLERRVEERTEALYGALRRAEGADRIKSAFLATMSHELRTPLNSILGFTGLILQGLAGPLNAEQTKQLGMVQRSARHLLDLINDVLDISKIEAGQMEVASERVDLAEVLAHVRDLIAPLAQAKGLVFVLEAPSPTLLRSDRRRLVQILINLANNAIKFTERGSVTIRARSDESRGAGPGVRVDVIDTGSGIAAEALPLLFQPFRQLDAGSSRQHEGTGLGLAICQRLARLLGGEVGVESRWGEGSVFSLWLPLPEEAA